MGNENAAHYSVGVYLSEDRKERKRVLVFRYRNKTAGDRIELRLPGGCQAREETPVETLLREWRQETGYRITSQDVELVGEIVVNPSHRKCIFLIYDVRGDALTEADCLDWDKPGEEHETGPPFWMRVEEAQKELFPSHQRFLEKALAFQPGLVEG